MTKGSVDAENWLQPDTVLVVIVAINISSIHGHTLVTHYNI